MMLLHSLKAIFTDHIQGHAGRLQPLSAPVCSPVVSCTSAGVCPVHVTSHCACSDQANSHLVLLCICSSLWAFALALPSCGTFFPAISLSLFGFKSLPHHLITELPLTILSDKATNPALYLTTFFLRSTCRCHIFIFYCFTQNRSSQRTGTLVHHCIPSV